MNGKVKAWHSDAYIVENEVQSGEQTQKGLPPIGVVVGEIVGLDNEGIPLVTWPDCGDQMNYLALTQVRITAEQIGRRCTLAFEQGKPERPIILGLLQDTAESVSGYRIIQAEKAVILQCGAARIELHEDGRVIVQGLQIDNQAYGPYRIKGASVKVN